jgi:circadian clock protein KaiC
LQDIVQTGVEGLDELIGGGIPQNRTVLVVGGPGTGKTILAAQFLYKGIHEHNENGIFVSFDESKKHLYSEMAKFSWDFEAAEKARKFAFIDATRISRVAALKEELYKEESQSIRGKHLSIDKLIDELQKTIQSIHAKRVVIDTLAALFYRFSDLAERRNAVVDLIETLSDLGITTMIITELGHLGGVERSALEEEYLVHGVIMMQTLFSGGTTTRAIQVEKMRGTNVNASLVPYSIDKKGIEIYPNMPLFEVK